MVVSSISATPGCDAWLKDHASHVGTDMRNPPYLGCTAPKVIRARFHRPAGIKDTESPISRVTSTGRRRELARPLKNEKGQWNGVSKKERNPSLHSLRGGKGSREAESRPRVTRETRAGIEDFDRYVMSYNQEMVLTARSRVRCSS